MFKKKFIDLCNKSNQSPTYVCKKIGLSNAAFSQWSDNSMPRQATLQKISDYFGVSVDYFLGKEDICPKLSKQEQYLLNSFRELNEKGKEYILQTMDMVKKEYKKSDTSTVMENIS